MHQVKLKGIHEDVPANLKYTLTRASNANLSIKPGVEKKTTALNWTRVTRLATGDWRWRHLQMSGCVPNQHGYLNKMQIHECLRPGAMFQMKSKAKLNRWHASLCCTSACVGSMGKPLPLSDQTYQKIRSLLLGKVFAMCEVYSRDQHVSTYLRKKTLRRWPTSPLPASRAATHSLKPARKQDTCDSY